MIGFRKITNAFEIGSSYVYSTLTHRPRVAGMPCAVSLELTNQCNLRCPECYSGSGKMLRDRGFMSLALFDKVMAEMRPYLLSTSLYFQGEPMLHPDFFLFLKRTEGIFTEVSTNGHFLTKENVELLIASSLGRLIISLDGMDEATYSKYRVGGDFESVVEGINNVAEARRRSGCSNLQVVIQFLVNKQNEYQIPEVRRFSKKVGAKLKLKSMQVINEDSYERWVPTKDRYSRYSKEDGEYRIKSLFPNRCLRLWINPVITWDGKVLPCCYDKDAKHVMGNLLEESFSEIWNGSRYEDFRRQIVNCRGGVMMCKNCSSGLRRVKG